MSNHDSALARIEAKLDDVRDKVHEMSVSQATSSVRHSTLEVRVEKAEAELAVLKSAHDKLLGVLKVLSLPWVASIIYAGMLTIKK